MPLSLLLVLFLSIIPSSLAHSSSSSKNSIENTIARAGSAKMTTPTDGNSNNAANDESIVETIGGGDINEKKRTFGVTMPTSSSKNQDRDDRSSSSNFDPTSNRSHLMHAIEGLDRYPRYLSRWSVQDMEELERSLEQRLEQVKTQKSFVLTRRQGLQKVVERVCDESPEWKDFLQPPTTWDEVKSKILDPKAARAVFRSKFFSKYNSTVPSSVQDVLSGQVAVELDAGQLEPLMEEEVYDVYSLPLLKPSFCHQVQRFIRKVMDQLETADFAHLNAGVRDLDNLGLGWLNDLLLHLILRPISRHLYQEMEVEGDLDWRQGYVAAYSASPTQTKPRQRLVPHTDDSEVTLNICLGEIFEGGLLHMWGLRGTDTAGTMLGEYQPEVGRALVHAGRHLHEVTEITSGNRYAYIMWARSWSGTRSQTCPCCWLNRKEEKNCACGAKWN